MTAHDEVDLTCVAEEPPVNRGADLRAGLDTCVDNAGEWYRIAAFISTGSAKGAANELRARKASRHVPDGDWEFRSGKMADGRFGVWARFLGGVSQ